MSRPECLFISLIICDLLARIRTDRAQRCAGRAPLIIGCRMSEGKVGDWSEMRLIGLIYQ